MPEKRKVEIEYTHYEPGDLFRHKEHRGCVLTCESFRPPSRDGYGKLLATTGNWFNETVVEPVPEPPITDAERIEAIKDCAYAVWPGLGEIAVNGGVIFKRESWGEALDELVRRWRKWKREGGK